MNKLFLSLLLIGLTVSGFSQRIYFVYLQTEQEQPFFVRLNDKLYSSSGSGYVILSRLRDSTYNMSVGFPQSKWPEQKFTLTVRGKDQGFLLKNFDARGWGLFDLQTLAVQMATQEVPKESSGKTESSKDVSPFTSLLAKAADDSTLKDKPVVVKAETPKVEAKAEVKVKDKEEKVGEVSKSQKIDDNVGRAEPPKVEIAKTEPPKIDSPKVEPPKTEIPKTEPAKTEVAPVVAVKNDSNRTDIIEQAVTKTEEPKLEQPEYKPSVVSRRSESSTSEGFGLTFIDSFNGTKDTITIFIPNPKAIVVPPKEIVREEKKFLDISSDTTAVATNTKPVQVETKPVQSEVKKEEPKEIANPVVVDTIKAVQPTITLSNGCKDVAVESDFLRLRKLMAAAETDDDMIDEARKYFRTKCFTTQQVKNLSTLFLNDSGKYKFFDLAYGYVSDAEKFSSLQSELKEEYYINRFKAMLRVI